MTQHWYTRRLAPQTFSSMAMRLPSRLALGLALALAASLCVASIPAQNPRRAAGPLPLYRQSHLPIEKRIDDLLGRMTLEEKSRPSSSQPSLFGPGE